MRLAAERKQLAEVSAIRSAGIDMLLAGVDIQQNGPRSEGPPPSA